MRRYAATGWLVIVLAASAAHGEWSKPMGRRVTRCCLALEVAGLPPGPVCAQVRGRRGIGPRLACRLLGGRAMGRGDCNPAVCALEPA
jgi:hypothetical protein